ncbi:hypothetical protein PLANTIT3_110016 [Plantibacter sp. T3]|nr:hypothetical protein PLANTIT3_110016 [Plantibacter sp. T3]
MSPPAKTSEGSFITPFSVAYTQFNPARNLEVMPHAAAEKIETLVRNSCVPDPGANYRGIMLPVSLSLTGTPLLRESLSGPRVLAAIFESNARPDKADEYSSTLWLPASARPYLADWVRYAISRWRQFRPDLFPESAEWRSGDEWASSSELRVRATLVEFDQKEAERVSEAAVERDALVKHVELAQTEGDEHRRLLESTGEELVTRVLGVLVDLGFEVVDADQLPQHKGKKREDLRISDGDWTAVAEVKGYTGAAKSNDLMQVQQAMMTYTATEGKLPDAGWYIINAHREMDPSQRPEPLSQRPDDVALFANNSEGSVLDVRELFRLGRAVTSAQLSADSARAMLRQNRGYFRCPPLS